MADIHIRREHRLGLAEARRTAAEWAALAQEKFDLACTVLEGEAGDVIEFGRPGLQGRLLVDAEAFDITATLGFLLGAFRQRIEAGIEENLDRVLAGAATARRAGARKPVARKSAAKKK